MTTEAVNETISEKTSATTSGRTFLDLLDLGLSDGSIEFIIDGVSRRVGKGGDRPPEAVVRVSDPRFLHDVLVTGNLALGEAYMRRCWFFIYRREWINLSNT